MKKSKLIILYETLDTPQLESLRKWVNSPIHNKHKDVVLLFDYILSRQKLTERSIAKEKIWKKIYPSKEYNDLRIRHLSSLSVKVLEEFIGYWTRKTEAFDNTLALAEHCVENGLEKYATQYLTKVQKAQQKSQQKNSFFYFQEYQLEQAIFDATGTKTRMRSTNLQAIFDNHSHAFIIETLRYACVAVTHQNVYKGSYEIPFLDPILKDIETGKHSQNIAVQFYYNSYKALTEPINERYFSKLKKLLFEHNAILPPTEIKDVYMVAVNYCVKRLNTGAEEYVRAVFDLFKYGLEYKILIEDNELSRFAYKNIVTAALKLKEHSWTKLFIKDYTLYLAPSHQQNYKLFAEAKLAFSMDDFDKTMDLLWQVEFKDLLLNIGAKMMLVKIYYQQGNDEALDSLLSSFYVFLQRKNLMSYHKTNYKNILKITQKLVKTPSFDKDGIQKLKEQIETTNPLTEREWLLYQLHQK